ncbi:hypothetical protein [Capnocytophaga gingivalis]|jgi:hypothetical protein
MKRITVIFLTSLISNFLKGQEIENLYITPSTAYQAYLNAKEYEKTYEKGSERDKKSISSVQLKEVDYPIYVEEDIPSKKRESLNQELAKYKPAYDEFQEKKNIATLIDKYLTSNEKRKIKLQYLIEAEGIIKKYTGLRRTYSKDNGATYSYLFLDKEEENRKVLEDYKDFINNKLKISTEANKYLSLLDEIEKTPVMDKKSNITENTIKKNVFVIDTNKVHFNNVEGTFQLMKEKYRIVHHKKSKTLPFEIISSSNITTFPNDKDLINIDNYEYSLIKNIESNNYYLITDEFLKWVKGPFFKESPFSFIQKNALKLDKDVKNRFYTEIDQKRASGMYPISEIDEIPDYENGKYIKFSSISPKDKFVKVIYCPNSSGRVSENQIIQNINTKQLFLVSYFYENYLNYETMGDQNLGNGSITMIVPKELTVKEKQAIQQFHSMLKIAYQKGKQLRNIQMKYLTRTGLFDPSRASATDRATYNKTLKELKKIYSKMREMERDDEIEDAIINNLSTEDSASLDVISGWYYSYDI